MNSQYKLRSISVTPQTFTKIFEKFCRIFFDFWSTLLLPIPLRPALGEGLLCDLILQSKQYLASPLLEHYKKFLSKESVHVTVFSITREWKEIKTYNFCPWIQEILEHESMLKSHWSICWPIEFEHTFMVGNILFIKFRRKRLKKMTKLYKEEFLTPN